MLIKVISSCQGCRSDSLEGDLEQDLLSQIEYRKFKLLGLDWKSSTKNRPNIITQHRQS